MGYSRFNHVNQSRMVDLTDAWPQLSRGGGETSEAMYPRGVIPPMLTLLELYSA